MKIPLSIPAHCFFVLCLQVTILAGSGNLDWSFASGGRAVVNISDREQASDVAIQPDGKIIVAGTSQTGPDRDFSLMRLNIDGLLDAGFGVGGVVRTPFNMFGSIDEATCIVILHDGKIMVIGTSTATPTGQYDIALARYNTNGSLDNSFDSDGMSTIPIAGAQRINDAALQPDGKIVLAGENGAFFGVRINENGTLDMSFDGDGMVLWTGGHSANAVFIQPDGKMLLGGTAFVGGNNQDFALVRYNIDGIRDTSFGNDGIVLTPIGPSSSQDRITSLVRLPDGRIVAGGISLTSPASIALAKYNTNGTLDTSFGTGGKRLTVMNDDDIWISGMREQADGKLVASALRGFAQRFTVVRYHSDGNLDKTFGNAGFFMIPSSVSDQSTAICLQADGKIIVAGHGGSSVEYIVTRHLAIGESIADFDGDGRSDVSVFRPSTGDWYLQQSTAGFYGQNFGSAEDRIVPADYDGDGKTDIAVYRPSTGIWYVANSSNGTYSFYAFGIAEDLPTPADYDGDGKADISVFRPSSGTWYRINSSDGSFAAAQFGTNGDKPAIGDFDGDGKADLSVFRPSTGAWYQTFSSNGTFFGEQFGISTDKITPADYDGDGKTDIAIYRASEGLWYVKRSATTTYVPYVFGLTADIPTPGDFDGDGKADIGVFRPSDGTWYIVNSSNSSYTIFQFGQNGDQPTQSAFNN